MNDVFQDIFLAVIVVSFPLIITTLYSVSLKKEPDLECIFLAGGLFTTLIEIFLTCQYGNEVTLNVSFIKKHSFG